MMHIDTETGLIHFEDYTFEPLKFAMWILQNNSDDYINSIDYGKPKGFCINSVEIFSIEFLGVKKQDVSDLIDYQFEFVNQFDGKKTNFDVVFYDEFLCEVYFGDFRMKLYPGFIFDLIMNGLFSFDSIKAKEQKFLN